MLVGQGSLGQGTGQAGAPPVGIVILPAVFDPQSAAYAAQKSRFNVTQRTTDTWQLRSLSFRHKYGLHLIRIPLLYYIRRISAANPTVTEPED